MANNLVYRGMKNFWSLFICNLAFLLGNSLFIFSFLFVKFYSVGMIFYVISAILFFPNLLTLFELVRAVLIKKEEKLFKKYFHLLKKNTITGLKLSIPYLSLIALCLINLNFLGKNGLNGFSPFFLVLLILIALHLMIVVTIKAELIISSIDAAKLGLYLISKYGIRSLVGVMILFFTLMSIQLGMQYFFLFGAAFFAAGSTYLYQDPLKKVVAKLSGEDKNQELMRQLM